MPSNFSFLLPGELAGMAHPGMERALENDLRFLHAQGIRAIVSLSERPLDSALLQQAGFSYCHLPVVDFHPPTDEQIDAYVEFVRKELAQKHPVATHCTAGYGRTGTMLACWLVSTGLDPKTAIARVRRERPGSIETAAQETCIRNFALRQKSASKTDQ